MIHLRIKTGESLSHSKYWVYRLSGQVITSNGPVRELTAFASEEVQISDPVSEAPSESGCSEKLIYLGTGLIGNRSYRLECRSGPLGYLLKFSPDITFVVTKDGAAIRQTAGGTLAGQAEILFGPVLTLALALQDVWCLHAGGVAWQERAVALIGPSGSGKSTISSSLDGYRESGFARIADDVLPLKVEGDGVWALPHFPQLKLAPEDQYPVRNADQLSLSAVYVLEPASEASSNLDFTATTRLQGYRALLQNSVAAQLFDRQTLSRHADFCSALLSRTPLRRLIYPLKRSSLKGLAELIRRDLGANQ